MEDSARTDHETDSRHRMAAREHVVLDGELRAAVRAHRGRVRGVRAEKDLMRGARALRKLDQSLRALDVAARGARVEIPGAVDHGVDAADDRRIAVAAQPEDDRAYRAGARLASRLLVTRGPDDHETT